MTASFHAQPEPKPPQPASVRSPGQSQQSSVPQGSNVQAAGQAYPYSPIPGRSVIAALQPTRRPTNVFWAGVFMLLAGLVLAACPLLLGISLVFAQGFQKISQLAAGALGVSGCFALVLLLPGIGLIMAGRGRR